VSALVDVGWQPGHAVAGGGCDVASSCLDEGLLPRHVQACGKGAHPCLALPDGCMRPGVVLEWERSSDRQRSLCGVHCAIVLCHMGGGSPGLAGVVLFVYFRCVLSYG
jgi:hypothetical protein